MQLVDNRPVRFPADKVNAQERSAGIVVIMVHKHISIHVCKHRWVTGSVNRAVAGHHLGPASIRHAHAAFVHVRAADTGRSTNHGTVRARGPGAASIERHPQVVVVAVASDVGCLDCAIVGGASRKRDEARSGALASAGVDRDHLDAGPEAAEREPPVARGVNDEVGVDGVVVDGAGRLDDQALVCPRPRRGGGARGKEDSRLLGAEARRGVVQVVLPVVEGDVRGPEVGVAVGVRRRPRRAVGERGPGVAPRGAVGRRLKRHVGPRVGHDVGAARALDDGGVVDGGAARDGARVGICRAYTRGDGHDGQHAAEESLPYGRHLERRSKAALGSLYLERTATGASASKRQKERLNLGLVVSPKGATFHAISTPCSYTSKFLLFSFSVTIQVTMHDSRNCILPKRATE